MKIDTYGYKIRQLRHSKNITQSQLAKKLGMSSNSISRYENNKRRTPDMEVLNKLSLIFDVNIDYFSQREPGTR
ncbi:helix-turn-helix transcriptional regulator [Cytobacillus sp. S13-E01]|uniref:helix-turn-helix domain-containing protein n=1 Tax=Cytobacillus sp. S13-E01 TaxID=3031326 RepID=UPI0023D82B7B|nr:helix-turn-helix transcriptional regulator [Cytobacillus sp. S13-E01]MDF0725581.1 helix-turn-helix transcriptional regulator [Cytobacillus sp. S13-E01]